MSNPLCGHVVGFIGLGLMGRPMCMNLHAAGAEVVIHNRSRAVVDALAAEGLSPAHSPREVAQRTPLVIVMASDTPAVEQIVGADDGIASGVAPGGLVIDMGTTAVEATRKLARIIEGRGGQYVDAPVSGGEIGAKAGTLTIMAGGSQEAVARAMPCFEVMGASVTHVGNVGAGQIAKAANQVIVGLTIGAVAGGARTGEARRRRPGEGTRGASGRVRVVAHPRGARPAHDRRRVHAGREGDDPAQGPAAGARPRGVDRAGAAGDHADARSLRPAHRIRRRRPGSQRAVQGHRRLSGPGPLLAFASVSSGPIEASFHAAVPGPRRSDWRSAIRWEGLSAMSGYAFGQPDLQLLYTVIDA